MNKTKAKTAFSAYIKKVENAIGNQKVHFGKQKKRGKYSVINNPITEINNQLRELEKSNEYKELVSIINNLLEGREEDYSISHINCMMVNFFRQSGCYLQIMEGDSVNINDYFSLMWNAFHEKEVKITTLHFLDSVTFPDNFNADLGTFKIQRFTKEELENLCNNNIRRWFYPSNKWDEKTLEILSHYWFIREDRTIMRPQINPNAINLEVLINEEMNNLLEKSYRVKRQFPIPMLQKLVLFDWNHDVFSYYAENERQEEREWKGFSIPFTLILHDEILETPTSAPSLNELKGYWFPNINPITEEETESFQPPIILNENQSTELKTLLEKIQRFSIIRPDQWKFLEIAMGYLAKAFFAEGLEQLLWHMTVLEALFCIKGERPEQTIKKRLDKALGEKNTINNKKFGKLYEFRSDLVHGKTKFEQVDIGHLWQARNLARQSVDWFLDCLLDIHEKLNKEKIQTDEYPHREEILITLDFDNSKQKRLQILLENLLKDKDE